MPNTPKAWYAVYTHSRAEKKVQVELDYQGIENYLPLQKKLRQWSDRKKWVEMPLISGYIFVNIDLTQYDKVLKTSNVVSYVRFEGKAAIIPKEQIELIQILLKENSIEVEVNRESFSEGDEIEVIAGPLTGLKGQLITIKGKKRVAVILNQLNLSLTVDLPLSEIRKLLK
ncbi:MAG: UpxY family transcription antiterminator [Prolixibacteraceae bacterium]